jgi:hypothetical protein
MSKPYKSPVEWAMEALNRSVLPREYVDDLPHNLHELRVIQNKCFCDACLFCPVHGCHVRAAIPEEYKEGDLVICPRHSVPMALMTWRQLAELVNVRVGIFAKVLAQQAGVISELNANLRDSQMRTAEAKADAEEARAMYSNLKFTFENTNP